jgi:hypothetical protein
LSLVVLLIAISFLVHPRVWMWPRLGIGVLFLGGLFVPPALSASILADVDSTYSRYQVSESVQNGMTVRYLLTDNRGAQSGYALGHPNELIFDYTKAFQRTAEAYGGVQNSLMIGGGTYTFPSVVARNNPSAHIDVVEIDPKLDEIAGRYFEFEKPSNMNIFHQDGRVFLNQNTTKYDVVYMDAFSSLSPPYQLSTIEASRKLRSAMTPEGIAVANVIASPRMNDAYFAATYHTYREVFKEVKVYRVQPGTSQKVRQNLLFVMGNGDKVHDIAAHMTGYPEVTNPPRGQLLTDDHAPIEQLIQSSEL